MTSNRKYVTDAPPLAPTLVDEMATTLRNVTGVDLSDEDEVTRILTRAGFRLHEAATLGHEAAKRAKESAR